MPARYVSPRHGGVSPKVKRAGTRGESTMARTVAKLALAVVAFGFVACLATALLDGSDAPAPKRAPEASPVPAAVSASDLLPTQAFRSAPARTVVAPAPVAAEPQRDAFRNWSESVAVLPKDLGDMGPSLKLALDSARNNDMAFCFRELENGGSGSRATDFMLYIETREDAVDVVEAKVARPGALPASVVECARDVLRGLDVKVFEAVPGQRFSYVFEVEA